MSDAVEARDVVTIEGKDVPLQRDTVRVGAKTCRQALNEHGFEIALFDSVTLVEVLVAGRPSLTVELSKEEVKADAIGTGQR
jgi:hypothetical protein